MPGLNESMSVVISQATKTVSSQNMGVALLVGPNINQATRTTQLFQSAGAAAWAAAFVNGASSPEYLRVRDFFAQLNPPAYIKLGMMANSGVVTIVDNAGTFTQGAITSVVNGVTVTTAWTSTKAATLTAHAAALQTAVRALTAGDSTSTVASSSATITFTPKAGIAPLVVSVSFSGLAVADTVTAVVAMASVTETLAQALAAIQLVDDDWYHVLAAKTDKTSVKALASFVASSASPKVAWTASADANIPGTTVAADSQTTGSIASQLQGLARIRTAVLYSAKAGDADNAITETYGADSAACAIAASFGPGRFNMAYKQPLGIPVDSLTPVQEQNARGTYASGVWTPGKDANTIELLGGFPVIRWGRTSGGAWIDHVIFQDALVSALQANVVSLFINATKVPRDLNGYAAIEGAIESVFKSFQTPDVNGAYGITAFHKDANGVQDGGYVISMPSLGAASASDKTNRVLNGATFTVWYATPINSVKLSGVIAL